MVAQLVEHELPKLGVEGSNPFRRSESPLFPEGFLFVCPAWRCRGGESPLGKLVAATPSEPQGEGQEACAERSGSRTASRRTETRYEAQKFRASGQVAAKLSRPKSRCVNLAAVRGTTRNLTWGDLASRLKGRRPSKDGAEREVSRGRSSSKRADRDGDPPTGSRKGSDG